LPLVRSEQLAFVQLVKVRELVALVHFVEDSMRERVGLANDELELFALSELSKPIDRCDADSISNSLSLFSASVALVVYQILHDQFTHMALFTLRIAVIWVSLRMLQERAEDVSIHASGIKNNSVISSAPNCW
jgi:hypothetical protein